jgi:hypothetical protein
MLKRNDRLLLTWVDIVGDEGGDPAEADLCTWQTVCWFVRLDRKRDTPVLVIRATMDPEEKDHLNKQSGYLCIPTHCVKRIRRLTLGADIPLKCLEDD